MLISDCPVPALVYHRELLSLVTPEAFRAGTLWPTVGASVDPGAIRDGIKKAWNEWQTQRIRERIERELEELRARTGDAPP